MTDIKLILKNNWPWVVGGVAGLYLLTRASSGGGGTVDYAASYAATQAAASAANLQSAQIGIAQYNAETARVSAISTANANMVAAQGSAAGMATQGASMVIQQLQAPTITAMNAAAAENISALTAAGNVATASLQEQASSSLAAGIAASGFGTGFGSIVTGASSTFTGTTQTNTNMDFNTPVKDNSAAWNAVGTAAGALLMFSDRRLKKNIESIDADISTKIIDEMTFVKFDYVDGKHIPVGFIAQELAEINDDLVDMTDESGLLKPNQLALLSVALQAIQALQKEVKELKEAKNGT